MNSIYGIDDLEAYQVHSRREIISLLRNIGECNQLLRMTIDHSNDAVVTSILKIDEAKNVVIIDCAPNPAQNKRIERSENISFETMLEHIRILFFANQAAPCMFENLPAFSVAIPTSMIRLQRREFYRVPTPITNPVICTITIPHEVDETSTTVSLPLQNISGGGIALLDEKKLLDNTYGRIYKDCRIDLPGSPIVTALQVRNSQDLTFTNGKTSRRVGCMFSNLSRASDAAVQRYITKLEREQNAKATGFEN
jgi:c-di-GMP-binding flagellar brake protein YcgR